MPDVSIVIKATDRYSDAIRTMQNSSRHFTVDLSGMQAKLDALNKTKATLKVDVDKARSDLRAAERQFAATGDAADELKLQASRLTFENARRNLALVTQEASNTERQMRQTEDAISRTRNRAGGGSSGGLGSVVTAVAAQGVGKMLGDLTQNLATTLVGSAFGSEAGTLFSSSLSSAISGAAIGTAIAPGIGTAIGAAAGGLVGAANGKLQVWEQRDDAFKDYVQTAYEEQINAQGESLTNGSALAAQRETDRISFSTLFGSKTVAEGYLSDLVEMSNNTPFLYDDLTAMSKTLATYKYGAGEILPVLQTIGDTGAALGMSTSDMTTVAQTLGRMKSSGKTSLEYLNILNDRGIGAVGMLADAYSVDQGAMYDMISKGEIAGGEAVEIILAALTDSFSGSMLEQSKTFSGLSSTVEGLQQELDNAMGEGYNQTRIAGLEAQRDWLNGDSGQSMQEAYRMMGQWQASLENTKEQLEREALESVMTGAVTNSYADSAQRDRLTELGALYQEALAEYESGNEEAGAQMGALLAEAQVIALNEYNASDGVQLALDAQKTLVDNIRNDTSLNQEYWGAGYEKGQWFSKGLGTGIADAWVEYFAPTAEARNQREAEQSAPGVLEYAEAFISENGYAAGLSYVPYDNFPALLHQGERVLTAEEARSERDTPMVSISGNTFMIREEADVAKVAAELLAQIELAGVRG